MTRFWPLAVALILSGCAGTVVGPGPVSLGRHLEADSRLAWNRLASSPAVYSLDGARLNQLRVLEGLKPGEHVFRLRRGGRRAEGPFLRSGMDAQELMELVQAGLQEQALVDIQSQGLRPVTVSGLPGYRFEVSYATATGLRYRGLFLWLERGSVHDLLLFLAPDEYYFERDRSAVEALLTSLRLRR